jgi:hypothetical protein
MPTTVQFDAASSGNADVPSSVTVSHTIGGNARRVLIVGVTWKDSNFTQVSSVTYNGISMTLLTQVDDTNTPRAYSAIYYLLQADLPAAGAYNVVVTFGQALTRGAVVGAMSFWNVKQQIDVSATAYVQNNAYVSCNITPIFLNSWIVDNYASGALASANSTPDVGQTARWNEKNGSTHGGGSTRELTDLTPATMGWTSTASAGQALVVYAISPAGDIDHVFNRGIDRGKNVGFDRP